MRYEVRPGLVSSFNAAPDIPAPDIMRPVLANRDREYSYWQEALRLDSEGDIPLDPELSRRLKYGTPWRMIVHRVGRRPVVVNWGGRLEVVTPEMEEMYLEFWVRAQLCGASEVDGSGDGIMRLAGQTFMAVWRELPSVPYVFPFKPRCLGIPVAVKGEPLFSPFHQGYLSYPIRDLADRNRSFFLMGGYSPLVIAEFGGVSTVFEVTQLLSDLRQRGELLSPFQHYRPEVSLVEDGRGLWEKFAEIQALLAGGFHGQTAEQKMLWHQEVLGWIVHRKGPVETAEQLFGRYRTGFKAIYGADPVEVFEAYNPGVKFADAVQRLRSSIRPGCTRTKAGPAVKA